MSILLCIYMLFYFFFFFFFNDTATTEIYTLSLHDALPIFRSRPRLSFGRRAARLFLLLVARAIQNANPVSGRSGKFPCLRLVSHRGWSFGSRLGSSAIAAWVYNAHIGTEDGDLFVILWHHG